MLKLSEKFAEVVTFFSRIAKVVTSEKLFWKVVNHLGKVAKVVKFKHRSTTFGQQKG